jgi:hypothetical protein
VLSHLPYSARSFAVQCQVICRTVPGHLPRWRGIGNLHRDVCSTALGERKHLSQKRAYCVPALAANLAWAEWRFVGGRRTARSAPSADHGAGFPVVRLFRRKPLLVHCGSAWFKKPQFRVTECATAWPPGHDFERWISCWGGQAVAHGFLLPIHEPCHFLSTEADAKNLQHRSYIMKTPG